MKVTERRAVFGWRSSETASVHSSRNATDVSGHTQLAVAEGTIVPAPPPPVFHRLVFPIERCRPRPQALPLAQRLRLVRRDPAVLEPELVQPVRRLDRVRRRRVGDSPHPEELVSENVRAREREAEEVPPGPARLVAHVLPVPTVGAVERGVDIDTIIIEREVRALNPDRAHVQLSLRTGVHELGHADLSKGSAGSDTPMKGVKVRHRPQKAM